MAASPLRAPQIPGNLKIGNVENDEIDSLPTGFRIKADDSLPSGFRVKSDKSFSLKETAKSYGAGLAAGAGGLPQDIFELIEAGGPAVGALGGLAKAGRLTGLQNTAQLAEANLESLGGREPANAVERIVREGGIFGGQEALIGTATGGPLGAALGTAHGTASGLLYGGLKELGVPEPWALGITALTTVSPIAANKFYQSYREGKELKAALKTIKKEFPEAENVLKRKGLEKEIPSGKRPSSDGGGPPPPGGPGGPEGPKGATGLGKTTEEIERFPSGLTKPKAVEAKKPGLGIITPAQQERAIEGLNKEAGHLTKTKFEEIFPTAKKLEQGYDFESAFQKGFGELEAQAQKFNPQIEISPLTKYLRTEAEKYRGIPTLDSEAKKIMKWIDDFRTHPQSDLKNLLRIKRSINRELKRTFDKSKISGVPDHYVNFLSRTSKEIDSGIRGTLPANSDWLKRYDLLNKVFKNYKDAEKIRNVLRPILKGEPTASNLRKIANDPKIQRLLEMKMGKQAAAEITQIAKDLETATKAINRLSSKTIKELDDIYPIPLLFVGMKLPGVGYVVKKVAEGARRYYGTNLLNPTTRRVYREAIEAAGKADYPAYKKATDALRKEQGLIGHEKTNRIGYKEPKLLEHKQKPEV